MITIITKYKQKGREPYDAADARHVGFHKFGSWGAPMVLHNGGIRHGVSQ